MKGNAKCYDELRSYCEAVPLIDCHDHSIECGPKYADPIAVIDARATSAATCSAPPARPTWP